MGVMPLLELRGIVKKYGDKTVLAGIELQIERCETIVLVGGSGCGKSTLARLVMGLEPPTAGSIFLEQVDLTKLEERERHAERARFSMVFQRAALLDSFNVFDNVAFGLRDRGETSEREIERRTRALLRKLDMEAAAHKMPSELSGGMAKRVGIARALVTEPEIIVYDEPSSGLDPLSSRKVDDLIESVREDSFVTSIVITHDMVSAYKLADRVVLLEGGVIAADGPPEEVFASHEAALRSFALSSGVDLQKMVSRADRKSAAELRAARSVALANARQRRLFGR